MRLITSDSVFSFIGLSGIDFSEKMIEISKEKIPNAKLIQWDFSKDLPKELENEKIEFIKKMLNKLNDNRIIFIDDVAFENIKSLEDCRKLEAYPWDEDEIYPVLELLKPHFPTVEFEKNNYCSGVFRIRKTA